jgi:hypothetical protein
MMASQILKDHRKTLMLIRQKGGCCRCGYSFGNHGVAGRDKFHPNCPRREGKENQGYAFGVMSEWKNQ